MAVFAELVQRLFNHIDSTHSRIHPTMTPQWFLLNQSTTVRRGTREDKGREGLARSTVHICLNAVIKPRTGDILGGRRLVSKFRAADEGGRLNEVTFHDSDGALFFPQKEYEAKGGELS